MGEKSKLSHYLWELLNAIDAIEFDHILMALSLPLVHPHNSPVK